MVNDSTNRLPDILVTYLTMMFEYIIIPQTETKGWGFDPLPLPDEFNPFSDFSYDKNHYD